MIKNGYLVSWISYLLKLGKLKVLVCCVESTLCQQIQKDLTGCDIDRVTLSDHTQDYKIVLARKEVMKILSSPFFSFIILNYSRLYISILPMSVHSALLLKVCIISCDRDITGVCFRREGARSMVPRLSDNSIVWIYQKGWHWKVTMETICLWHMDTSMINRHQTLPLV